MINSKSIKNTLDELMEKNEKVFILPHTRLDFDAIGAAIGTSLICNKKKKENYIIIDDDYRNLDSSLKKILEDVSQDFKIIRSKDVPRLMGKSNLLLTVDVNKDTLISEQAKENLEKFDDVLVIDHHNTDEHTIKTDNIFIDEKLSSASEIISMLLFLYDIKLPANYANYLLAGIILDTNKLSKNTSEDTYLTAAKLISYGASAAAANDMFVEDYETDRKMLRIVNNVIFPSCTYAIAYDDDGADAIYNVEDIARAADYLLKYRANATFALGYIDDDTISISARSKGRVDVSSIMRLFGGGGNVFSAAAKVKGKTLKDVASALNSLLVSSTYLGLSEDEIKGQMYEPQNEHLSLKLTY